MNKQELHHLIEYVRHQSEFPFDVSEVEEQLEVVLSHFGIDSELDTSERMEVIRCLRPRGLAFEVAEASRYRQQREDAMLGVHIPIPSERALTERRARFLEQYGESLHYALRALISSTSAQAELTLAEPFWASDTRKPQWCSQTRLTSYLVEITPRCARSGSQHLSQTARGECACM